MAAALLGLLLFQPLLQAGLPQAPDAFLHFYRAVLWRSAVDQGSWWPRWHTLLYQGYGYPLFNFYAPLLYALAALASLAGIGIEAAFKVVLLLACLAYPVGMYLWARDVLGRAGAIVAAAAYAFAAYRFRELYFLGGYAQFLAWALFPWALFFCHRLARAGSRAHFLGAALSLAAVVMSHNISAMLFCPVYGVYVVGLAVAYRRCRAWRPLLLASLCGLALSAPFWLPALGEAGLTRVKVLTEGGWDVGKNFVRPRDLFTWLVPLDSRAVLPRLPFSFGPLHLALAGLGLLTLAVSRGRRSAGWHMAFAAAGLAVTAFMMLDASEPVWRSVPLLPLTEYPWRMYGPALLFSSLLAGAAMAWLDRLPRVQIGAAALAVAALILSVAVYQFPRPFVAAPGTILVYPSFEKSYRVPGTTSGGEYLSKWTQEVPEQPAAGAGLARTALYEPAAGQSGTVDSVGPERLDLTISLSRPATVTVAQFYFPGWSARVDGAATAALSPAPVTGLIQLALPAGQHRVALTFEDTPARRAGQIAGLLALAATAALAVWLRKWRPQTTEPSTEEAVGRHGVGRAGAASRAWSWALPALVACLFLVKVAWIEPHTDAFRLTSPPGTALPAAHQTRLPIGDKVTLIGYDLERTTVRQGEELPLTLYWQAGQRLDRDYSSYAHLTAGPGQKVYATSDRQPPGRIPATDWTPAQYVLDDHSLLVAADAPPVAYDLEVGLYDQKSGERLGSAVLPVKVYVEAAGQVSLAGIDRSSASRFGSTIRLLGHRLQATSAGPELTLYWQAAAQPDVDYHVFVHLLDAAGQTAGQSDSVPVGGLYPTSLWRPGQIITDTYRLPQAAGAVALELGLYDIDTMQRAPAAKEAGGEWANDAVRIGK